MSNKIKKYAKRRHSGFDDHHGGKSIAELKKLTEHEILQIIEHAIVYKHSKSGGHGGQNVNKRETKAEGYLNIETCSVLEKAQRDRLAQKYHNHISKKGVLRLTCQEQRHYHQNLVILKKHFQKLLTQLGSESIFEHKHRRHRNGH